LQQIVGPEKTPETAVIHQDASLYSSILLQDQEVDQKLGVGRYGWLQVARGSVTLNGTPLSAGDGAAIEEETALKIVGAAPESEFLLFDLA